ncbi:MAG: hypothetical protein R2771_08830 [Saprospiraceae bacterium]
MSEREDKWNEKWSKSRKYGRIQFAIMKAFYISAILAILGYLFVYLTNYSLKTSYLNFALVLFLVMFIYKFLKNYFIDWPRNEKIFNEKNSN